MQGDALSCQNDPLGGGPPTSVTGNAKMRIYLAGIALIATLIAGCSADRDPVQASQSPGATGSKAPGMPMDSLSSRPATASFASLPDRGELLRYSPARRPE